MRQRVVKVLAALIITGGGVAITAVAASASGSDSQLTPVVPSVVSVVASTDAQGWE
jgi:hypothetical protein